MNLYEINAEIELLLAKLEIYEGQPEAENIEKELNALEFTREKKIGYLAKAYKNEKATIEAISEEIKVLQARKKTAENKANWISSYLFVTLSVDEVYQDGASKISWAKLPDVLVINKPIDDLPPQYVKIEKTAKLSVIREAIKNGEPIPFADLVSQGKTIRIK